MHACRAGAMAEPIAAGSTLGAAMAHALCVLGARGDDARADAEILLAHATKGARHDAFAFPERCLSPAAWQQFKQLVARRTAGEPVAYLTGEKEFWSIRFEVTADTLIPRPETERLVEVALELAPAKAELAVADLGTGAGVVAIALAHERPRWRVTAVDRSAPAIEVARRNARRAGTAAIDFQVGSWCEPLAGRRFDLIVANPPYVAEGDPHLARGDLRYEPRSALVSANEGLADIDLICRATPHVLTAGGWLILEHGHTQAGSIREMLNRLGFEDLYGCRDWAGNDRVIAARYPGRRDHE